MKKKIVIFGTGSLCRRALIYINGLFDIVAFSDNNNYLHGSIIDGITVIPPADILLKEIDGIFILSSYDKEIHSQLINIGVDDSLITNGREILTDIFQSLLDRILIKSDAYVGDTKGNVSFFIDTLGNGGAEKALVDLTKMLSKKNISASLTVTFNTGHYFNSIPDGFPIKVLFNPSDKEFVDLAFTLIEWKALRRILRIADSYIEVSFLDGLSSCLVVAGNADKKIGWIHSDLTYYLNDEKKKKDASILYSLFTDIVFVTRNAQVIWECLFSEHTHVQKHVIYNIVNVSDITRHKQERPLSFDKITFVAVGRLDYVKGFDLLISICNRLNDEGYDNYQLLIIGEGNDRLQILKMIEELNVPNVSLLGHLAYLYQYIDAADFLISSSRYEGFSLVILESLLLGTPVIATKTAGSIELITRLGGGVLVENNADALYLAMKNACNGKLNEILPARENFEDIHRETCDKIIDIFGGRKDAF
ncbi:MAG: glycosyltransferase [Aeromonas sp.]